MGFPENLFNKLFPDRQQNKPVQVMELLRRNVQYRQAFDEWKINEESKVLVKEIERSYYLEKNQIQGKYTIHLFRSPAANGFALTQHPDLSPQVFQFLLDLWRDRILATGYRLANTDRQIRDKGAYVETTEKHYLKPPLTKNQPQAEQRFGNVLLEFVIRDQEPAYIKVLATTYSDRIFTPPKPFDDLLDQLFKLNQDPSL